MNRRRYDLFLVCAATASQMTPDTVAAMLHTDQGSAKVPGYRGGKATMVEISSGGRAGLG